MRKGSDLVGKPIVAFDTGEEFERVQDLLFDQHSNQLLGFLVDEGGWFSSARVLPLENVQTIGPDAIIVPSKTAIANATQVPAINRVLERNNVLKGTKIMTTDGRDLGTMADLYFDERTGAVEGYEVSGGIFADAYTGRSFVPAPQTLKIGEDVAFVPPETADLMEEQLGGIKAAAQTGGERLQETTQSATASLTNATVDPAQQKQFVIGRIAESAVEAPDGTLLVTQGQQVTPLAAEEAERQGVLDRLYRATGGSISAGLSSRASGLVAGSAVEEAIGRRVLRPVRTNEGMIIAAPSQIVTEQVVNRARTFHKEAELLDAVGLSSTEAARAQAGGALSVAGDRLSATTQQAKAGTGNLWERLKEKVNDLSERSAQEAHAARIKAALGRPVSRVILDPQDNVILNVGELITHQAIARAEQAGVLDILLGSVYDKDPEISREELRAPESGDASLEHRERNATL
ncbi:MAG: PRC-barrel domain-containing protein [Chloroflexota bacterium]|nr:PRC-barrel domain-containing protein [Chloroflexota bacterium]